VQIGSIRGTNSILSITAMKRIDIDIIRDIERIGNVIWEEICGIEGDLDVVSRMDKIWTIKVREKAK